jgi:hypothetical protein
LLHRTDQREKHTSEVGLVSTTTIWLLAVRYQPSAISLVVCIERADPSETHGQADGWRLTADGYFAGIFSSCPIEMSFGSERPFSEISASSSTSKRTAMP